MFQELASKIYFDFMGWGKKQEQTNRITSTEKAFQVSKTKRVIKMQP